MKNTLKALALFLIAAIFVFQAPAQVRPSDQVSSSGTPGTVPAWPEWPKEKQDETPNPDIQKPAKKKPSSLGPRVTIRPDLMPPNARVPEAEPAQAIPEYERALREATARRTEWQILHAQLPATIPENGTPAYYQKHLRLIEQTRAAKRLEIAAWVAYYRSYSKWWRELLDGNEKPAEAAKTLLDSAVQALAIERQELADAEARRVAMTDSTAEEVSEIDQILNEKKENIRALIRTIDETKNAEDIVAATRKHAQVLIDCSGRNLHATQIDAGLFEAIYGGMELQGKRFSAKNTPAPVPIPRGTN